MSRHRGQAVAEAPHHPASFHPVSMLLQQLINLSNEVERELARNLGVNLTDYRALTVLAATGPTTVGSLAVRIGATAATTTAALNRLEAHGFVARERADGDRRQVVVSVTPAVFERIMHLMGPVMTRTNDRVLDLPAAEQAAIEDFLRHATAEIRDHLAVLSDRGPRDG